MNQIDSFLKAIIVCPRCKNSLAFEEKEMRCSLCGTSYYFVNGIPVLLDRKNINSDLVLTIERWDREYQELSRQDITKEKASYDEIDLREALREIERFILPEHKVFLEIGCGPAFLSLAMAKKGYTVIGIDVSIQGLKIAQKVFEQEEIKGYFICANILATPIRDGSIDFINGSGVLEHFKNTIKASQELFRVLKNDGVAFNTVPYLSLATIYRQLWGNIPDIPFLRELAEFFHFKILKSKHMKFGYEKSFSQKGIGRIFGQAGFREVKTGLFDCYLPFASIKNQMMRKMFRRLAQSKLFWPMIYVYGKK